MGVPVTGYSLDIGRAHTDFAEAKLQKRLIEGFLTDSEVDQLAVIAMAGATAEGMQYEEVHSARSSSWFINSRQGRHCSGRELTILVLQGFTRFQSAAVGLSKSLSPSAADWKRVKPCRTVIVSCLPHTAYLDCYH
jgi:hypothetical protein